MNVHYLIKLILNCKLDKPAITDYPYLIVTFHFQPHYGYSLYVSAESVSNSNTDFPSIFLTNTVHDNIIQTCPTAHLVLVEDIISIKRKLKPVIHE